MGLRAVPLTRDQVNAWISEHHRHHGPVAGYRYAVGAMLRGELVGAAVVGRPRAQLIPQYSVAEVTRVCSAGARNVCSFLYARASRMTREHGFDRVHTYILESESGASLKAAGWVYCYTTRGGTQNRPARPRVDKSPTCPKQVWAPEWCANKVTKEPDHA